MNRDILQSICIFPSTTIKDAMARLNESGKKILFVTDAKAGLLGTITDGDIRRWLVKGRALNEMVETIMRREYIAIDETTEDLAHRAKTLMYKHQLVHLPVIDRGNHIKDVITLEDILGEEMKKPEQVQKYDNRVVIMAGGKGTRLDAFTKVLPKPLIPIGDKPVIELIMERFYACGFHKFTYTLNYKKEYIKLFLQERKFPYEIHWIEEDDFLGTAGSLSLLKDKVQDSFFVVNCDTLLNIDFSDVLRWHKAQEALLTVVGAHNEVNIPYGVLMHSNGTLERIQEKPNHEVIINTGMYVIEPVVVARIPERTKVDMNELINQFAKDGRVAIYPVYGQDWLDIGQWDEYKNTIVKLS